MIYTIVIISVIIVILWTIYLFIEGDQYINNELKRISFIESKIQKISERESYYKQNTIECKTKNLNTPRDCFVHSNYKCKWCELSNRCNIIE